MVDIFHQFYQKSKHEKITSLVENQWLQDESANLLLKNKGLTDETANHMIENQIGIYGIPMGIAPLFLINHKDYVIPMVCEEPSVIAAASKAAKIIRQAGGFQTIHQSSLRMGQIAIQHIPSDLDVDQLLKENKDYLLQLANSAHPSIVKRGGGAVDLHIEWKKNNTHQFLVVYLVMNTLEAMGANIINTMLEALVSPLEQLTKGTCLMAILTNLSTESLVSVECHIPTDLLETSNSSGIQIRDAIVDAYQFASLDPYRAATHNKGIMNGMDAVCIATGNDWRALEAGAHAYAASTGQYLPLTTWSVDELGQLKGNITLPIAVGTVGGSIAIHPTAKISHELLGYPSANELASILASVGLAQNFAALRALVSDGIQKGHMRLHARSLAIASGAKDYEVEEVVQFLLKHPHMNQEITKEILKNMRSMD